MFAEHVKTLFLVSWCPQGAEDDVQEEHTRKADAMASARYRSAESWMGMAVVEMLVQEDSGQGTRNRLVRAWEVTPDACEQVSGGRERHLR